MSDLRLALITRRFWPLLGEAESLMADLADDLVRQGVNTQLATARWEKNWPSHVVYRSFGVSRLNQPKARGWGTARYMQAVSSWIRRHRSELDGLLIAGLRHDAHAGVRCGKMYGIPVVVMGEGVGHSGDCHWQTVGRFGMRIRETTVLADAWVAPNESVQEEMLAAGYPEERGRVISPGVPIPEPRTVERRAAARRVLTETHQVFAVPPDEPLVVYAGTFEERKGLADLVTAWRTVVEKWPSAKLWLLGDGPHANEIWQLIREFELRHTVIMPGAFDDLTEILYAADAFVLPSHEEAISITLLRAMAVGVPVVVSDIPANRALVDHQVQGLLFPIRQPHALFDSLEETLSNSIASNQFGMTARSLIEHKYSLHRMTDQYLSLFRELKVRRAREQNQSDGKDIGA